MLIVHRRRDEAIVVDGPAVIRVLGISGRQIKIGIEAPATTRIDREEIAKLRGLPQNSPNAPPGT